MVATAPAMPQDWSYGSPLGGASIVSACISLASFPQPDPVGIRAPDFSS